MRAALLTVAFLCFVPAAHAAGWKATSFPDAAKDEGATPRAAITAGGSSTVAFKRADGRLVMTSGTSNGRVRTPKVLTKRAADFAVAPGAVAWEAKDGVYVYARGRARRVVISTGSAINGIAIAADPLGGYVLVERTFPATGRRRIYSVRAMSLDGDGKLAGPVQDLGAGQFGIDARSTQSLSVLPDGRALFVFQRDGANYNDPTPVVLATRPHGGVFGEPLIVGDGYTDARITGTTLTVIDTKQCGDAGCAGAPRTIAVNADGTLGAPTGPALDHPGRALAPWATAGALVFLLKTQSQAFSREAPVRAYGGDGRLQTLTTDRANEPAALALSGGRTLALWATRTKLGAALAGPDGTFKKTAAPSGPPPWVFHFNPTNRDFRSAGAWVIAAWQANRTVRVSVRHF